MKMIRAIIRPEKEQDVVFALEGAGFPAMTKAHVFGRGKQKGLQVGPIHYSLLSKILLLLVVNDDEVKKVMSVISDSSKTGFIGDGKIFITDVEEAYTIRTGAGL
ncbi:MAG: P-II family nitrogen regulator [Leptonema illini]|jgi:nitrogen regulatory protein PII 1|uniref:P-II family nitrogen regulator n=1 Tax=Leptonema illini TaxID=183 RepID=A0A833H4U7_9LEPT|nr:MAG: P-II family nitrogen regulator [Leptonema illini]